METTPVWDWEQQCGLYCTGVGEILEHGRFFDPACKQLDQLAVHSGKTHDTVLL